MGISFYIFLVNVVAHLIKGLPGFYFALALEVSIALIISRLRIANTLSFPKGNQKKFWILSLIVLTVFFYKIAAHAPSGSDTIGYFSYAMVFERGDFPIHTPWQPEYKTFTHIGLSLFLGAVHGLASVPLVFIQYFTAFLILVSISQTLMWFIRYKQSSFTYLILLPVLVGLISLGSFMIAWPTSFSLPETGNNLVKWLNSLPNVNNTLSLYGSPTILDGFIYFFHRLLALSVTLLLIFILIFPHGKNSFLGKVYALILILVIGLIDESSVVATLPVLLIFMFFKTYRKSILNFSIFLLILLSAFYLQGGLIKDFADRELNRNSQAKPTVLIFPKDKDNRFYNFLSYRLVKLKPVSFETQTNYKPLQWFHPGITLQLITAVALCVLAGIFFKKYASYKEICSLLWVLSLTAITSFVAYFAIVPNDFWHKNGDRFLAQAYYFSGLSIAFFITYWWINSPKRFSFIKILVSWILLISIIPSLTQLFPRPVQFWFKLQTEEIRASFKWVKKNIPINEKIIVLTDGSAIPSSNIGLVSYIGAHTPIWGALPRSFEVFDTNPTYADLFYTLNPQILKSLGVRYLILSEDYLKHLPENRKKDILNPDFFHTVFTDDYKKEIIVEVTTDYLSKAQNLGGTFEELNTITPKNGAYYLDQKSLTENKNLYRTAEMTLVDREIYGAYDWFNARIDFDLPYHEPTHDHYDYLVLGEGTDPKIFCNCNNPILIWNGLGNNINLWKTN